MTPRITIAVQCHDFQRRFLWMLSSLAQQTKPGLVIVDVAHMPGNGQPTTEEVCALFGGDIENPNLKIKRRVFESFDRFQYRGAVRNEQLQGCETEWLLFGDCDMVYHPQYFENLLAHLDAKHPKAKYMLSSGRMSNPKEQTTEMVNAHFEDNANLVPVVSAYPGADLLPKREKGNVGAGFCQLINVQHCPHGGYYVDESANRDVRWSRSRSKPKSDMQFRKRISQGGNHRQALPEWFTHQAIHLNHNRDEDMPEGTKTKEQR
jgi:hypothetical protein